VSDKPTAKPSELNSFTQSNSGGAKADSVSTIRECSTSSTHAPAKSNHRSAYSLVTPVYNEEAHIGRTIDAVVKQSILPLEWIIVSDGSTDQTDKIVARASLKYPWIRLLSVEDNPGVGFARVVNNTEYGISQLRNQSYQYLGLLDADVTFQCNYFEELLQRFIEEPKLGLAGGVVIDIGLPRNQFPLNRIDVPGATQFFRRTCFESIGRLIPIPEGGWDGMTCAVARMKGYKTHLITDLVVDHHKPRNISQGGLLKRKYQMGMRDYAVGYHPLFELVKCISRTIRDRPLFFASAAWFSGYVAASLRRRKRIVPKTLIAHVQKEQLSRLLGRQFTQSPKRD